MEKEEVEIKPKNIKDLIKNTLEQYKDEEEIDI